MSSSSDRRKHRSSKRQLPCLPALMQASSSSSLPLSLVTQSEVSESTCHESSSFHSYRKSSSIRHNEGEDSTVTVAVRVRPFGERLERHF